MGPPGTLEDRDVIYVFTDVADHVVLSTVIAVAHDGEIHAVRDYYFCPELLGHAALQLGVGVATHGHQYPLAARR